MPASAKKTIVKNPDSKKQEKTRKIRAKINEHLYTNNASKPYVRTQQVAVRLAKNLIKKESNKVITNIKHSKTHYKGNSVIKSLIIRKRSKTHYKGKSEIQSLLISRKIIKRERSTPKGVIYRLYTSINITVHSYLQKDRLRAREKRRKLNEAEAHIHAKIKQLAIANNNNLRNTVRKIKRYEKTRNEQQYGNTKQAISSKNIKSNKINIIKSQAYLLLTAFADPP